MTVKEIKSFLSQTFTIEIKIRNKRRQLEELSGIEFSIGGSGCREKVQSSPKHDKIGELVATIEDLRKEYSQDLNELLKAKQKIKTMIDTVKRDDYRLVLELRYIECMKWDAIADEMNYHVTYVQRLHGQALLSMEVYYTSMI